MSAISIKSRNYSLKIKLPKNIESSSDYRCSLYSTLIEIMIKESLNFIKKFPVQKNIKEKYFSEVYDLEKFTELQLEMLFTSEYNIMKLYQMINKQIKKSIIDR